MPLYNDFRNTRLTFVRGKRHGSPYFLVRFTFFDPTLKVHTNVGTGSPHCLAYNQGLATSLCWRFYGICSLCLLMMSIIYWLASIKFLISHTLILPCSFDLGWLQMANLLFDGLFVVPISYSLSLFCFTLLLPLWNWKLWQDLLFLLTTCILMLLHLVLFHASFDSLHDCCWLFRTLLFWPWCIHLYLVNIFFGRIQNIVWSKIFVI